MCNYELKLYLDKNVATTNAVTTMRMLKSLIIETDVEYKGENLTITYDGFVQDPKSRSQAHGITIKLNNTTPQLAHLIMDYCKPLAHLINMNYSFEKIPEPKKIDARDVLLGLADYDKKEFYK